MKTKWKINNDKKINKKMRKNEKKQEQNWQIKNCTKKIEKS